MERGEIIDRLIAAKKTQESGSAFRPAREADMMRRLVERHHGILPLDTAESIWRVIIATFTYVQAPFSVHADLSAGDALMRDSARFHFGFTVPFVPHMRRGGRGRGGVGIEGRPRPGAGLRHRRRRRLVDRARIRRARRRSSRGCRSSSAPIIRRRSTCSWFRAPPPTPWSPRSRSGACGCRAGAPRRPARRRRWPRSIAVPDSGLRRRGAAGLGAAGGKLDRHHGRARQGRRLGALGGPRRQPRDPLYGAGREALSRNPGTCQMTATRPQPRPGVLDIEAYVPGKSSAPGVAKVFKLSSNETPLGPSPKAIAAYNEVGEHLEDYPDGSASDLREAIGRAFGLDPDRIVCGAGSDDLLNLLARAYLADGDEAIHTTHGFLVYPIATLGAGATPVVAPEKNYTADVDAILKRVTPKTKIVFLANPNNPTGTYMPFDEVKRLHNGPAAARAARARRGLCRIRPPQRLRGRHRAGRDQRERGDDAHVLEDPRARRAAPRLDVRAGACGRRDQPHPRAVQRQRAGDRGRHRGDRGHRAPGALARAQHRLAAVARPRRSASSA